MDWLQAIVLGVVQGLTEFLPISSSAHIRVVSELAGWEDPGAAFTAVTQLGTESAVLVYFRHDIVRIVTTWCRSLVRPELLELAQDGARYPSAVDARADDADVVGRYVETCGVRATMTRVPAMRSWTQRRSARKMNNASMRPAIWMSGMGITDTTISGR